MGDYIIALGYCDHKMSDFGILYKINKGKEENKGKKKEEVPQIVKV